MTIDERIEAIGMHLELLSHMHQDLEKKHEGLTATHQEFEKRMTQYSAEVKDAIARLTNIAGAHDERLDEHEKRIENLEN